MIPFCLIVGNRTGVDTADALAAQAFGARSMCVGARILGTPRTYQTASVDVALIALGLNEGDSAALARNALALRQRVPADHATWLALYSPSASAIVNRIAMVFRDAIVPLATFSTKDGVHPASYRPIAGALDWLPQAASLRLRSPYSARFTRLRRRLQRRSADKRSF